MLNVSKLSELDLSAIDVRRMTTEERDAVTREVIRRARAERAKLMHDLIKWLRSWWNGRKPRRVPAVQTYASSDKRPPGLVRSRLPSGCLPAWSDHYEQSNHSRGSHASRLDRPG